MTSNIIYGEGPAIVVDRALPEGAVPDDFDGTARPRDGKADVGAHEWRAGR